jgi:hypothetical protein
LKEDCEAVEEWHCEDERNVKLFRYKEMKNGFVAKSLPFVKGGKFAQRNQHSFIREIRS